MLDNASQILKAQKMRFLMIGGVSLFVIWGISHFIVQDFGSAPLPIKPIKVDLPIDKVNVQDIWMNRQDNVLNRLEMEKKISDQKMKMLEDLLLANKKKDEESEKEKIELKKTLYLLQQDLKAVSIQIEQVKSQEVATLSSHPLPAAPSLLSPLKKDSLPSAPSFFSPPSPPPLSGPYTIVKQENERPLKAPVREYRMPEEKQTLFPVDEVVPAAVSVKALLVSSVDAVCGVYSNSDPVPVKLRLIDDAHLPKGVTVKLKGSLVIASAYGNISNERVYMRLERLTEVNAKGEASETEVVGYVSGEDGKFGVRGTVIDRSAKIIKNAAASGFLGGIGQVLQASVTRPPTDGWNAYSIGTSAATKGAANGVSSAFDMLADYYIKRAEQVQPVLQVNAGRIVDITFTHGFARGDANTKEKLKEIRQRCRRKTP